MQVSILADSLNPAGVRLTTMKVVFPRCILAEFNTHRAFSRNSASSRAQPISTVIKKVKESPFIPLRWMKQHKGMQGSEYFEDPEIVELLVQKWLAARDAAVQSAQSFLKVDGFNDVTKQMVNRLLEPFLYHEVIVTATDWENFFAIRNHPDAEIHIQKLAEMMMEAYNASTPKKLATLEWHIPFSDRMDKEKLEELCKEKGISQEEAQLRISTARCARISYGLVDDEKSFDYVKDWNLCKSLAEGGHWSPFEHCAYADSNKQYVGNFRGFVQYRKLHDNENRRDDRVIQK